MGPARCSKATLWAYGNDGELRAKKKFSADEAAQRGEARVKERGTAKPKRKSLSAAVNPFASATCCSSKTSSAS